MKALMRGTLAVSALLASMNICAAQTVEWSQTLNLPKGYNLPSGMKAEILGIELGESHAEARPKMEALRSEAKESNPLQIMNRKLTLMVASGPGVQAAYTGQINLERYTPGTSKADVRDTLRVSFTAPSSGYQVYKVQRILIFREQADQPRISELVEQLKKKFGSQYHVIEDAALREFLFIYDGGKPVVTGKSFYQSCPNGIPSNEHELKNINPTGQCDVYLRAMFTVGISRDHADSIEFELTDQQRAKENITADFAFFAGYAKNVQDRTRGPAPKL